MRIDDLGIGDENKSMGCCAGRLAIGTPLAQVQHQLVITTVIPTKLSLSLSLCVCVCGPLLLSPKQDRLHDHEAVKKGIDLPNLPNDPSHNY